MSHSKRGSTRAGVPAALPGEPYDPPAAVTGAPTGHTVRFEGEDGREMTLPVGRLPLPGWHPMIATAIEARVGPSGTRRTAASVDHVWAPVGRVLRFLDTLPEPPAELPMLTAVHLSAFMESAGSAPTHRTRLRDLRALRSLMEQDVMRGQVTTEVMDFLASRAYEVKSFAPRPGYSDREFRDLVAAARSDVANIRDRLRGGERLLSRWRADPDIVTGADHDLAALLDQVARDGAVPPAPPGPTNMLGGMLWRTELASHLVLTRQDLAPLLVLFVAVAGRNVETIKELPAEHRVLEDRAVELRVVKRRRGPKRWYETVTWEIGKPGRELHTPGGLYLLVHELTARSRAISNARFIWSIWRHSHPAGFRGTAEHVGIFDESLARNIYATDWAESRGLTTDQPTAPGAGAQATSTEPGGRDRKPRTVRVEGRVVRRKPTPGTLPVDFNRVKTSVDVRHTKQMGGHLPSAARSNTYPVLFSNYLRGDPTTLEWAQDVVGQALVDAERSALDAHQRALDTQGGSLRVITGPADAEHLHQAGLDADTARKAADGDLDTAWSGCTDHDHHPATGTRCRASFLDCFHCGNCLITRDHLPRQLGLLDALAARRHQMSEQDWWGRYGAVWAAIRRDVLVKFSPAEIKQAQAIKPDDALLDLVENPWESP